ncbi:MAG: hypothetical protein V4481_01950 [Patescibacteria group bacterium]
MLVIHGVRAADMLSAYTKSGPAFSSGESQIRSVIASDMASNFNMQAEQRFKTRFTPNRLGMVELRQRHGKGTVDRISAMASSTVEQSMSTSVQRTPLGRFIEEDSLDALEEFGRYLEVGIFGDDDEGSPADKRLDTTTEGGGEKRNTNDIRITFWHRMSDSIYPTYGVRLSATPNFNVGLKYKVDHRTVAIVRAGYELVNYDENTVSADISIPFRKGPVVRTGIRYNMSRTDRNQAFVGVNFRAFRSWQFSTMGTAGLSSQEFGVYGVVNSEKWPWSQ